MHLSASELFSLAMSAISIAVQAIILVVLTKRKLQSTFRLFFIYNIYCIAAILILDVAFLFQSLRSSPDYFYIFWALTGLQLILQFGVLYEACVNALKPYSALIDLGRMLFYWASLFLVGAATLMAFGSNDTGIAKCVAAVQHLERGILLVQCGLLLLFFLFEKRLGLSWRSYSISIALGLGVSSALALSFSYLRQNFVSMRSGIEIADTLSATAVLVFWAVCLYLPEPKKRNVLDSPMKLVFQRWNDALLASPFAGQAGQAIVASESFLPSVERTVERVMARKMTS